MIRFTTGVMSSGKTEMITSLDDKITSINTQEILNHKVTIFSPTIEDVFGCLESRNGEKTLGYHVSKLTEQIEIARHNKTCRYTFIIDEAQFLNEEQIKQIVYADIELHNVDFHLFGLLTNFKGDIFMSIDTLLQYVEVIDSMPKVCDMCENKLAIRNIRVDKNNNLILDGEEKVLDKDKYITVCKTCYTKMHNKCQRKE